MSDREIQINAALTHRLNAIGKELDGLSPELLRLILMVTTGANGETPVVSAEHTKMARMRLNEALCVQRDLRKPAHRIAALVAFSVA